jgi:hypothetical protein
MTKRWNNSIVHDWSSTLNGCVVIPSFGELNSKYHKERERERERIYWIIYHVWDYLLRRESLQMITVPLFSLMPLHDNTHYIDVWLDNWNSSQNCSLYSQCNEGVSLCFSLLGQEERCSWLYRWVRCLFEFVFVQMTRIVDAHLLLYFCAWDQARTNRTEWTISYWSINHGH